MKKIRAKHIKDVQGCEKFQGFISCADPRERIFEIEKSKSLHFPLRQLNLRYCNSVTSQGLKDIVRNCPFISQLSLEGSVSLSVDVLPEVIEKLHDLRKLNISHREDKNLTRTPMTTGGMTQMMMGGTSWNRNKNLSMI